MTRALLALAVATLAAAGCAFDDAPPDGAVIVCVDDADCPASLVCNAIHECRRPDDGAGDAVAPGIVAAAFDRAFVAAGSVALAVGADEPLRPDPPPLLVWDGVADPGFGAVGVVVAGSATWTLADAGAAPEGAYPVRGVALADAAGNGALRLLPDLTLVVDRRAPTVLALRAVHAGGAAAAAAGLPFSTQPGTNEIDIAFAVDEGFDDGDVVVEAGTLSSADGAVSCTRGTANDMQCRAVVVAGAFSDVVDRVSVNARDRAGNAGDASVAIALDLSGPGLVDAVVTLRTPDGAVTGAAIAGGRVEVDVVSDELLGDGPAAPALSIAGDATLTSTSAASVTGVRWRLAGTFGTVGTGTAALAAALTDRLGNVVVHELGPVALAQGVTSPCPPLVPADCIDFDADGDAAPSAACAATDCDDTDPLVHGAALEVPGDGRDNDCAGDGDLALDESAGVFVDDTVAPGGDGTRASPASTFDDGELLLAGRRWLFLAADTGDDYSFGVNMPAVGVVGGLVPSAAWTRGGARSRLFAPDGASGNPPYLEGIEMTANASSSLTLGPVVVVDSNLGATHVHAGTAVIVDSFVERYTVQGLAGESLFTRVNIGGQVRIEGGLGLTLLQCRAGGDFNSGLGPHFLVDAGARLDVVNSAVGSIHCLACGAVGVRHSIVGGSVADAFLIGVESGAGAVSLFNNIFLWREASPLTGPAVLRGDQTVMSLRQNLFDVTLPVAFTALDGVTEDCAGIDDLNGCATCLSTNGNFAAPAELIGDLLHVANTGAAVGAGDNDGDLAQPAAAAADVDGECRPAGAVDIGPDQH